ncbi:MAG: PQQ-binding-like beta-propeller repeat protein [Steroidobacter sp.]
MILGASFAAHAQQPAAAPNPAALAAAQAAANTPADATRTAPHPGKSVYERTCAACHDNAEATRSPSFATLKAMRYQTIRYALLQGKMQTQAAGLSAAEKSAVVDYLVGREPTSDEWIANTMCAADRRGVDLTPAATIAGFGFDAKNHRRLSAAQAGLKTADFRDLELVWALGFPKATTMRSQPAIVGTTMFLPVADAQRAFAIDIAGAPCLKWVYENDAPLRTSTAYGELPGSKRKVIIFGDLAANIHMVDAATGEQIWKQPVGLFQYSLTTGTPVLHGDRVYVPISQYEISLGANENHECCKTHGAVTALDAKTGKPIWTTHTMPDAKPVRDRGDGKMLWGPSGAPIWNSPAIDEKRGVLYVGTGESTSEPAWETTDAILAIDLKDGSIRWSFQATQNDIFLSGCGRNRNGLNCPKEKDTVFRDVDFGASVVLAKGSNGADVLLAGQKSGTIWALDPDNKGKVIWRQDFGVGSPLGGIHWGIAYDGERVFAPINRPFGFDGKQDSSQKPGMHAVKVDTGEVQWTFAAEPDCSSDRESRVKGCANNIGLSGAPTVIDGAVLEGSLDGFLRAFDAASGEVLFQFDTARPFDTINAVTAHGGAIDNASIVAANGYLFVSSGYGMFGQTAGNVLLAFRPKKSK